MIFIPCTTGTLAVYQIDERTRFAAPIEAWDDQGIPYVAGTTGLVQATTLREGFLHLEAPARSAAMSADREVRLPQVGRRPTKSRNEHREKDGV